MPKAVDPLLVRRIEDAALRAWPALEQHTYGGWLLRFAQGYTKRANSVTPLEASHHPLSSQVACCEEQYRQRNLVPIFRLAHPWAPPELDDYLAARGYALIDPTQVMWRNLIDSPLLGDIEPIEQAPDVASWMAINHKISGSSSDQTNHARIVKAIQGQRLLAWLEREQTPVACGLGVLEDDCLGLFDLTVASEWRRRGLGTALVHGMLHWAQKQGAEYSYLQVTEANEAAKGLYTRMGFRELYRYWYRVAPSG